MAVSALLSDGGRTAAGLVASRCRSWSWLAVPLLDVVVVACCHAWSSWRTDRMLMRSPFIGPRCCRGARLFGARISDIEKRRSTRRCVDPLARLMRRMDFILCLQV